MLRAFFAWTLASSFCSLLSGESPSVARKSARMRSPLACLRSFPLVVIFARIERVVVVLEISGEGQSAKHHVQLFVVQVNDMELPGITVGAMLIRFGPVPASLGSADIVA